MEELAHLLVPSTLTLATTAIKSGKAKVKELLNIKRDPPCFYAAASVINPPTERGITLPFVIAK